MKMNEKIVEKKKKNDKVYTYSKESVGENRTSNRELFTLDENIPFAHCAISYLAY